MREFSIWPQGLGITLLAFACSAAHGAPVVVQKGSTAQYLYIPATSVGTSGGGGTNDGATAAKQFCQQYYAKDATVIVNASNMLEETLKVGAVLIGGGSGANYAWPNYDFDTGQTYNYKYVSGGGGGATALLKDGVPVAVAAGADAPTGNGAAGLPGKRITAPEFTLSRSAAAPTLRIIIGGGGGSGGPQMSNYNYGRTDGAWPGWGGRGYFGGGSGSSLFVPSDLGPGFVWPTPARGGTTSGGTGAVAPAVAGSSDRINGQPGYSMAGAAASGYGYSAMYGRIFYTQRVVNWSFTVGFQVWTADAWPGYEGDSCTMGLNGSQICGPHMGSVHAGKSADAISERSFSAYGAGAPPSSTAGHTSGTAGAVMLYYSAPQCNILN